VNIFLRGAERLEKTLEGHQRKRDPGLTAGDWQGGKSQSLPPY
jgi:hypothetical protein